MMEKTVIRAGVEPKRQYLKRVIQHRRLITTLALRDIKSRFAQTFLGWTWMIIRPLATLGIFTVFFSELLELDTGTVPYPAFAFSGMLVWYLFSGLVQSGATALQHHSDLIRKTNFPRIILPLSRLTGQLFEFSFQLLLLMILLVVVGHPPRLAWLTAPLFLIPPVLLGLGLALWLNVATLRYRDWQHLIPYLVNAAIWFTPVFYPVTIIPDPYQEALYFVNPVASSIEGLRWAVMGTPLPILPLLVGTLFSLVIFGLGFWSFSQKEHKITDLL